MKLNQLSLLLFMTVIPVILILVYIYQKDKHKEPIFLLIQLFGLGILSCLMVLSISQFIGDIVPFMNSENRKTFLDVFLYAFIGVALVEESCKWLMLYTRGYYTKEFDERYDMIVYAIFVSLGFAFFENAFYIYSIGQLRTAIIRAVSAVPGHACDAVFMGYYLSLAKQCRYQKNKSEEIKYKILSIIIPTMLHGIYDFCIMSKITILIYVFIAFVIFLYIISIITVKNSAKSNNVMKYKDVFCKKCGAKLQGNICQNCGMKQD